MTRGVQSQRLLRNRRRRAAADRSAARRRHEALIRGWRLERHRYDISRTMEISGAVRALAALAQESRLEVFRTLAREAPAGLSAGAIASELGVPPSTLSFHLEHLANTGLVSRQRDGRSLVYSLDVSTVRELMWFLG